MVGQPSGEVKFRELWDVWPYLSVGKLWEWEVGGGCLSRDDCSGVIDRCMIWWHGWLSCHCGKTNQPLWRNHLAVDLLTTFNTLRPRQNPDNKVHVANVGPTWGRQDPGGPHVGPVNLAIWECRQRFQIHFLDSCCIWLKFHCDLLPRVQWVVNNMSLLVKCFAMTRWQAIILTSHGLVYWLISICITH